MPILTPEERVGTTLSGKYRLDRILATGGMATVFTGTHAWTERTVAVKILNYEHARDPEVVRRFFQEARAAAQLKHPNIVDVLDMGQDDDGTVFLVLELLEGETLKARLKRGPIALHELAHLLAPILRAVAAAHAKGVVHRDLKPDNIFLAIEAHDGAHSDPIPKLLDFGIAKVAGEGDSGSTRTGTMVGTPQYMSPEQVRGDREVGPRADVWSMGVLLHYGLTKAMPFNAESAPAVLARVLTERAKPIRTIAPHIPEPLAAVIDRALQHDASHRFADMREMAEAFEQALGIPVAPREASRLFTSGMSLSLPPSAGAPIGATPTAIVAPAPIPTPVLGASALPSEYPPSPTTPYAWGVAPPPVEDAPPPPRRLAPIFAAGAAVLMLLGGATFWVVLGPLSNANQDSPRPLAPLVTTPAAQPSAPPIAPPVAPPIAPSLEPAVIVPTPTEVATTPVATTTTTTVEPTRDTQTPTQTTRTEPTRTEPTRTEPARTEPARTEPTRTTTSETATTRRTETGRTETGSGREGSETTRTETPATGRRGTNGVLILSDDAEEGSTPSGPRRGTRGAIILH